MSKFFVPIQKIKLLKSEFAKVERKAKKLNLPVPILTIFETETEVKKIIQEDYHRTVEINVTFVAVEVEGKLPVFDGWNLVAAIEHERVKIDDVVFNTVKMVPGEDEIIALRTVESSCDHCGHNRFRKNTYLLHNNDTDETVRVGSTCVKDFLGDEDPAKIINSVSYLNFLDSFKEVFEGKMGSFEMEHPIKEILAITSAEIRLHGWVSKGDVWNTGGQSTAEVVTTMINKSSADFTSSELRIAQAINDSDEAIANGAIEWLNSFDLNDVSISDYIYNAALCVKKDYLHSKDMGVACSIISSYKNHVARLEAAKIPKKISNFVGAEKERLKDMELIFLQAWTFDSSFGVCTIIRFSDNDGNIFVWKTGYFDDVKSGTVLIVTGTVKKHEIYKETKQTIITRCKWDYKEEVNA